MDAFQFQGTSGDRVLINAVKTDGDLACRILLYPPGGGVNEADSGALNWIDYQLKQTGQYTIVIRDFTLDDTGTYQVSLLIQGTTPPPTSTPTPTQTPTPTMTPVLAPTITPTSISNIPVAYQFFEFSNQWKGAQYGVVDLVSLLQLAME